MNLHVSSLLLLAKKRLAFTGRTETIISFIFHSFATGTCARPRGVGKTFVF